MKFDPFNWQEVKANEEVPFAKGRLRLRLSAPAPVFIECEGVESLLGFAAEFEAHLPSEGTFTVEGPVRVFAESASVTSVAVEGEVFTNIDRMPGESGSLLEVTRARRLFEMERRAMLAEIRAARDEAVAKAVAALKPAPLPRPRRAKPLRRKAVRREARPGSDALVAVLCAWGLRSPKTSAARLAPRCRAKPAPRIGSSRCPMMSAGRHRSG